MKPKQRSAAKLHANKCRCGRKKNELWHLLCPRCWDLVPAALQRRLFTAFERDRGGAEHTACVRAIFELLGPRRNVQLPVPPGMTSTTTPAGIRMHDEEVAWD